VYFDAGETAAIARWGMPRPAVIEPTVKDMGACVGANKQRPVERHLRVAAALEAARAELDAADAKRRRMSA
jgi:hypothetical protein